MNLIKLKSRAKINLSIDVLGKREDGYHFVEMIMQTIDLYDTLTINILDEDVIKINTNSLDIPIDEENIVYKATKLIKDSFGIKNGVEIYIDKKIPVAGGMAGGSSNAAATLVGLNKIFDLKLDDEKLKEIGLKLGADVPFCMVGGTFLAQNIGEKLTKIEPLTDKVHILVCKPELFVSTKEVYEGLDLSNLENRPDNKYLIRCLENNDISSLSSNMKNVLESVTSKKYSEIDDIKNIMKKNDCLGCMMSGSGPTVFGIFDCEKLAKNAKEELLKKYNQVFLINSSDKGVDILNG